MIASVAYTARAAPAELRPDYDQRAPSLIGVSAVRLRDGLHFRLGFGSAAANVGDGPLRLRAHRSKGSRTMVAHQLVLLTNGSWRAYRRVGQLRYVYQRTHQHWHFEPFERYELRRASNFELVVHDRKAGFCLHDLFQLWAFARALFIHGCGSGVPSLTRLKLGTAVGYMDRYFPFVEGQFIDVTGVDPGLYLLVHRVNPEGLIVEKSYGNNAASALLRIDWPNGRRSSPRLRVLRTCEDDERCSFRFRR